VAAPPIVLSIAGFDPTAGAGVAADLKTFSAHNCYGVAAITALTVQSTQGVKSVHDTPAAELRAQLDALLEDLKFAAIKIGMLGHRGNAIVVADFLDRAGVASVVLDPVMKSTSGDKDLIDAGGIRFLVEELMKRVTVVTPNIAEAEILSGLTIKDHAAMEAAARPEAGSRIVHSVPPTKKKAPSPSTQPPNVGSSFARAAAFAWGADFVPLLNQFGIKGSVELDFFQIGTASAR